MNFFIMVSLFLSAALGVFRGIDLALLTDAETGLCIVGSVWLRYGALAVAVGAAVAAGRCSQPQAGALRGHCTPSGVVALAAAVCYGEAAVLRILWMGSSVVMLLRAVLEALCAFWMIGLGLSWLRKDWKIPTRSLTPAVLGPSPTHISEPTRPRRTSHAAFCSQKTTYFSRYLTVCASVPTSHTSHPFYPYYFAASRYHS